MAPLLEPTFTSATHFGWISNLANLRMTNLPA